MRCKSSSHRKSLTRVKLTMAKPTQVPSSDQIDDLWDVAPMGLALLDKNLQIFRVNQSFREFSPKKINPYFRARLKSLIHKATKSGQKIIKVPLSGRRGLDSARP